MSDSMKMVMKEHGVVLVMAGGEPLALEKWSGGLHIWQPVAGWSMDDVRAWLGY